MRISSHSTSSDINIKLDEISNELKEIGINYVGHGVVNYKGERLDQNVKIIDYLLSPSALV